MSELIISSQDIRYLLTLQASQENKILGKQAAIRHFLWIMSEYAGRERAIIGATLSSNNQISNTKLSILSSYSGRVLNGWDIVQKMISNSDIKMTSALANIKDIMFTKFEQKRSALYNEGLNNMPYSLTTSEWINESTKAINTILKAQKTSVKQTKETINILKKDTYNSIMSVSYTHLTLPTTPYV